MQWNLVFPLLAAVFAVVSSGMAGGFRDADINDEGVKNALNFAVVQHNRRSNDMYLHNVAEVVKAQSQVVAGIKYVITVKLVKTGCRKDPVNEECNLTSSPVNAQPYQCTFTVWSRPWLSDIRLLDTKC
ncbi:cystatin C (amyloid angiopathy and cerebral hemorrhage) [Odontesthes bonariensis]|uniref:cystatin C (amyloid angiopathy and cerebral hemorrhage) n=1 Tax=Odontesthes bonariensis TaxID=219752 RepID=UPI003F58CF48